MAFLPKNKDKTLKAGAASAVVSAARGSGEELCHQRSASRTDGSVSKFVLPLKVMHANLL